MSFWADRRVLVTGHTGFKGAWAARWLARSGAQVTGLSLAPDPAPNLARSLGTAHLAAEHLIDLRDLGPVAAAVQSADPEIVLHMAAQPIVRAAYDDPVGTYATNVMGTVHLLEALRSAAALKAILIVTSDKVYENDDSGRAFTETDRLGGHDPYSASKAATEIAASSYGRAFYEAKGIPVATARGGNVIGGGDFAADRLVPDIVRAAQSNEKLVLRNPQATRPWQHVLDCLSGYRQYIEHLMADPALPRALNFGPMAGTAAISTSELAGRLQDALGIASDWDRDQGDQPLEKALLSVDASQAEATLDWKARLDADATVEWTASWYSGFLNGADPAGLTDAQIDAYEELSS